MAYEQVKEIIGRAQRFHRDLSAFYEQAEGVVKREKVRIVLDYLRWHEHAMEERLREFVSGAGDHVMGAWFQYTPAHQMQEVLQRVKIDPDMTVDEVIELALKMDEGLLEFYRTARDIALIPEVREVFDGLYKEAMNERAKVVLALMPFE